MKGYRVILLVVIVQVAGCWRSNHDNALEVTYIANEGFMISMGSTKVLIDALSKSEYYASPSDSTVAKMMDDIPPFDKVDYLLVTHAHPDHFNAELMSQFLLKHPAAQFIANSETCNKLKGDDIAARSHSGVDLEIGKQQIIRGDKVDIAVLRLAHGTNPDINNLAFVVRSNGYTIVHVGDTRLWANEEYLRTIDWSSYDVDLLFMEYSDDSSPTQDIIVEMIKPKHVILMHISPGEEESVKNEKRGIHPRTVVFGKENELIRFDNLAEAGSSR